ncbi:hypothetical protein JHN63_25460 [Streptomyces sp. MBT65]|uniref:hypothetical protein n=1 Tax=Streptomyces sp. MBT65 TaxID=1488395 RepID=UPI00190B66D0|nr:hypothetical protein [Streptomyces sp. MBT65]MBK3577089.1 hypothetical protein [Streptomyces sp. MBT65]
MRGKDGAEFTDQYLYESALAGALEGLGSGAEPPMPDLVPGAVVRGTRMRRRRRAGAALSAAVMAGVLAVGGHALLAPRPERTPTLPAGQSTVWYPSLELLRSILPAGGSTRIEAENPRQPLRPGRYFKLTSADGSVNDLYVGVSRTAVDPSYVHLTQACLDLGGRVLGSPWNGLITRCTLIRHGSGSLLNYFVTGAPESAPRTTGPGSIWSTGLSYLTPGGWTVTVIAGSLDAAPTDSVSARNSGSPRTGPLLQLATDPRIFDAVKETGG